MVSVIYDHFKCSEITYINDIEMNFIFLTSFLSLFIYLFIYLFAAISLFINVLLLLVGLLNYSCVCLELFF